MAEMLKSSGFPACCGHFPAVGGAGHHSTVIKAVPGRKKEA